jgi:hypothetical protein
MDYNCEYLLIDMEERPLRLLKAVDGTNEIRLVLLLVAVPSSCFSVSVASSNSGTLVVIDSSVVDGSVELDVINLSIEGLVLFEAFL